MTYCSGWTGINPESLEGNVRGFDPATVYRTYDDYADDADRAFLEYFPRDAYQAYGYDFHYYHGEPVDETWVQKKIEALPISIALLRSRFAWLFARGSLSREWLPRRRIRQA